MAEYRQKWIGKAQETREHIQQSEDLAAEILADKIRIAELEEENKRLQHEHEVNSGCLEG